MIMVGASEKSLCLYRAIMLKRDAMSKDKADVQNNINADDFRADLTWLHSTQAYLNAALTNETSYDNGPI
jgi:hypothetical protein